MRAALEQLAVWPWKGRGGPPFWFWLPQPLGTTAALTAVTSLALSIAPFHRWSP